MSNNGHANGHAAATRMPLPSAFQPANPDRLPPHNLEAELALIGSLLWDNTQIARVEKICKPEHLWRATHQIVYRRILDLHAKGTDVDAVSLADELEKLGLFAHVGGNDFLAEATASVPHALHAHQYAWIVRQKARMRGVIEEMGELIRRAYNQHEDPADVLDGAITRLEVLREDKDEDAPTALRLLPRHLADAAYHGIAAEAARIIEPDCESSIEGVFVQLLVILGNEFGPKPHWTANTTRHPCNEYVCLVGPTAEGRKNTSNDVSEWMLARIQDRPDRKWRPTGLSTGEGLIQHVLDNHGEPTIFVEDEFDGTLAKMGRDGNTLSTALRWAWNGPNLGNLTRGNPLRCTNAYVSLIAMTNYEDLARAVTSGMLSSGLANRFLWINVYQARWLSLGGDFRAVVQRLDPLLTHFRQAFEFAKQVDERIPFFFTKEAEMFYDFLYKGAFAEPRIGAWAKATRRRAAHCRRLALIFAVLDCQNYIDVCHLEAAKAIVDYSDATAAVIFGGTAIDEEETKIIHAFKADALDSVKGWTRTQINRRVFGGHKQPEVLDKALAGLHRAGVLTAEDSTRNGKLTRLWKIAKKG